MFLIKKEIILKIFFNYLKIQNKIKRIGNKFKKGKNLIK